MQFLPLNTVVANPLELPALTNNATININILVTIAVDVSYIVSQQGKTITTGIYMMDNSVLNGSAGEGSLNLVTAGSAGSIIGWNVVPIYPNLPNLSVEISFVQICLGNVFGSPATAVAGNGYTWIAELTSAGQQTYAIQIKITEGLNPVTYFYNWIATVIAS